MAWQATLGQHFGHFACVVKAFFVAINVQDALFLQIEVDVFCLGPGKQMLTRSHGQLGGFNGVLLVVGHGSHELCKPRNFVPAGFWIDQQRCIALEHPLQALDDGGGVGPDFCIGSRQLPAIGKRSLHGGIAMTLKQSDREAALGQCISCGDASNATADNSDCFHDSGLSKRQKVEPRHTCACGAPSVLDLRDSQHARVLLAPAVGLRTKTQTTLQNEMWHRSFCLRVSGAVAPSALLLEQSLPMSLESLNYDLKNSFVKCTQ